MRFLLVIAAICATATPAAAAEPFEIFKQLCVETQGEPGAATERARARGWAPRTEQIARDMDALQSKGAQITQSLSLYGGQRESGYVLLISPAPGEGADSVGGPAACEVTIPDGDIISMSADVERWAGFKPVHRGLNDYWLYSLRQGSPVSENSLYEGSGENLKAALATRQLFLVATISGHSPTFWLRPFPSMKQGQ